MSQKLLEKKVLITDIMNIALPFNFLQWLFFFIKRSP